MTADIKQMDFMIRDQKNSEKNSGHSPDFIVVLSFMKLVSILIFPR